MRLGLLARDRHELYPALVFFASPSVSLVSRSLTLVPSHAPALSHPEPFPLTLIFTIRTLIYLSTAATALNAR
ncbi:hypothetical protein B0H17DRAFT_1034761 [Mycena rosella]|uniref:Uncharacterized protein n=1 Tax=Mycena rosella TaxID=1033263 RepID=A0AAD7M9R2_MYCRO|nr:hypothetical protein B0H17DRAFT_1034761 [Mycena rosella]